MLKAENITKYYQGGKRIVMKPYRIRMEYAKARPDGITVIESEIPHISWAVASDGAEPRGI